MENTAKYHLKRKEALKQDRSAWEQDWQDVADFVLPRKNRINNVQASDGKKSAVKAIDKVATRALRVLAAGMQGGLTSPSRPWFRLAVANKDIMERGSVRPWLDYVERLVYHVLARSNFYNTVHTLYLELGAFGTGLMLVDPDPRAYVRFRVLTIGEYFLATDSSGRVDTMYRDIKMSARQMVHRFGMDKLPGQVRRCLDENRPDETFELLHAVQPRWDFNPSMALSPQGYPWSSTVVMPSQQNADLGQGQGVELEDDGHAIQPFMGPRWDVTGTNVYGDSPAKDAMEEVKLLQEMSKSQVVAVHKMLNPPMRKPSSYAKRLDLTPGAETAVNAQDGDAIKPLLEIRPEITPVRELSLDIRQAIREHLFNDLFLMLLNDRNMTATEVRERHEEKLLMLGPVVERLGSELLDLVIMRVLDILERAGLIPEPPGELLGQNGRVALKLEYISLLAQAQKLVGTQSIRNVAGFVSELAQAQAAINLEPTAADRLDTDKTVDLYADMVGSPADMLRPQDAADKMRAERAKLRQQQQEMEMAMQAVERSAKAGKDMAQAETKDGNALEELKAMVGK